MNENNELPDPRCAHCKAFYDEAKDEFGVVMGRCRRRPELGDLRADVEYCHLFRVRDSAQGKVKAVKSSATGKQRRAASEHRESSAAHIPTLEDPIVGDTDGEIEMDRDGLKQVLRELLQEETLYGYPQLGAKWEGGTMALKPQDEELQAKEIPLETFFNKIVMLRDRLRVLEAKINSKNSLSGSEKLELQGYISKCYGTLTTFNALFQDKGDHFKSKS